MHDALVYGYIFLKPHLKLPKGILNFLQYNFLMIQYLLNFDILTSSPKVQE
jgi:hypothetical protein